MNASKTEHEVTLKVNLLDTIKEFNSTDIVKEMGVAFKYGDNDAYNGKRKLFVSVGKLYFNIFINDLECDIEIIIESSNEKSLNENYIKLLLALKKYLTVNFKGNSKENGDKDFVARILLVEEGESDVSGNFQSYGLRVEKASSLISPKGVRKYQDVYIVLCDEDEEKMMDTLINMEKCLKTNYYNYYEVKEIKGYSAVICLYEATSGEDIYLGLKKMGNNISCFDLDDRENEKKMGTFEFTTKELVNLGVKKKQQLELVRILKKKLPSSFYRSLLVLCDIHATYDFEGELRCNEDVELYDFLTKIGVLQKLNEYLYDKEKMRVTYALDYFLLEVEGHVICIPEVHDEMGMVIYENTTYSEAYKDFNSKYFRNDY